MKAAGSIADEILHAPFISIPRLNGVSVVSLQSPFISDAKGGVAFSLQ